LPLIDICRWSPSPNASSSTIEIVPQPSAISVSVIRFFCFRKSRMKTL